MISLLLILAPLTLYAIGFPLPFYGAVGAGSILLLFFCRPFPAFPAARRGAAIVLSFSVALVAADLLLRMPWVPSFHFRPYELAKHRWPPFPELSRYDANYEFQGEVYGDLAALSGRAEHREVRTIRFRTDERGFRNDPGSSGQPIDLIVLGDSFGLGEGISQEETLASILHSQWGLRTYNLSIPGSPKQELMNLKTELPHLNVRRGTIVLWAIYSGNDLHEKYDFSMDQEEEPWFIQAGVRVQSFRQRSPLRRLWCRLTKTPPAVLERGLPGGGTMLFLDEHVARKGHSDAEIRGNPNYPLLEEVFSEMRRLANDQGLEVRVMLIPTKEEVYPWILEGRKPEIGPEAPSAFAAAIAGLCSRHAIPCVDLKPMLQREALRLFESEGAFLWWRDDSHWNARGNAAAAELVERHLLRR